jgi:hypothetical protein
LFEDSRLLLFISLALLAGVAGLAGVTCTPAHALIDPPATLAGPSSQVGEFGGAAVSADGGGGVVYSEQVGGVQHVFAAQYSGGQWRAPVRVDWQSPYGATYPRIAAANGGWLVVVWVSQIATVNGRVQRALYASTLEPGASSFGEQFTVDPNVGEGQGVNPSLAIAASGQGLVAYRAVTDNYTTSLVQTTIPQLHPGDVLADIRIARYDGQLWSSPVRINRDSRLSMRAPSETNGPQAGIGNGNQAVVAWQEPESNGTARIWARRVFGSTLGLATQVSPTSYDGQPVTAEAEAFALGVSEFGEAKVVSLVAGNPGTLLGGPRMFSATLPVSTSPKGSQFSAPALIGSAGAPPLAGASAPSVAIDDQGNFRVAFTAAGAADVLSGGETGSPSPEVALGPTAAQVSVGAVTALNPEGGGVTAWPASDAQGQPGVGVREDFPGGAAQSALLSGAIDGPVSQIGAGDSESGAALVGFREGVPGAYEIVGVPVTVPPPAFSLEVPTAWVTPAHARFAWSQAEDATGGVTYSLILDGRVVQSAIHGLGVLPDRRLLGSGVRHVQILASDASGQQTLSGEGELKVDGSPPVARVRRGRGQTAIVSVHDAQSGAIAADTRVSFGDGAHANGRLTAVHTYARPGRYVITVEMRDKVGNSGTAHLRVTIG